MPQVTQLVSGELGSTYSTRVPCHFVSLYEIQKEDRWVRNEWFGCPAWNVLPEGVTLSRVWKDG